MCQAYMLSYGYGYTNGCSQIWKGVGEIVWVVLLTQKRKKAIPYSISIIF